MNRKEIANSKMELKESQQKLEKLLFEYSELGSEISNEVKLLEEKSEDIQLEKSMMIHYKRIKSLQKEISIILRDIRLTYLAYDSLKIFEESQLGALYKTFNSEISKYNVEVKPKYLRDQLKRFNKP